MQRYGLDEARRLAEQLAQRGNCYYYVVRVDDEYTVVSARDLSSVGGTHHNVEYAAGPRQAEPRAA
jgi:hypothetical protein